MVHFIQVLKMFRCIVVFRRIYRIKPVCINHFVDEVQNYDIYSEHNIKQVRNPSKTVFMILFYRFKMSKKKKNTPPHLRSPTKK